MTAKRLLLLAAGSACLLPISGNVQADIAVAPIFSPGAETASPGGTLMNLGQTAIGFSTAAGVSLHAGAIPCYLFSTPVTVVAWRSVRNHSGAGDLSIPLSGTAAGNGIAGPTVEPRLGGIQRIEIDFSAPVSIVNTAGVSVTGRTTSYPGGALGGAVAYVPTSVAMADADTLAISFGPNVLPDETCYDITIGAGAISNLISLDNNCSIRSLLGDTTLSGVVNLSDAIFTQTKIGQAAAANVQHDVTLSGGNILNSPQVLFIKGRVASPPHQALCP
jgi:hypothetical protein